MNADFYTGDNQLTYCVSCGIDCADFIGNNAQTVCPNCGQLLRNRYAGLALSGGGYRAALFHMGSLWRLNELGWLKRLAEITSVSGGSITAAHLGANWHNLQFTANGFALNFEAKIVLPVRALCAKTIDVDSVILGCLDPFHRPIDYIAAHYRRELFGNKTLQDLPADTACPRFTIYAANLQTGADVRFSRPYLSDYHLGKIDSPQIPLAMAVAASCALPPILSPLILRFNPQDWTDWDNHQIENTPDKTKLRRALYLTDGGVYDNLGLERIWDRYATVLVSDAGAPFCLTPASWGFRFSEIVRTIRAVGILTNQNRALRKRWLLRDMRLNLVKGAYWGINTEIANYQLQSHGFAPPLLPDTAETRALAHLRTRLNRFNPREQESLINWGYALTDAAVRRHLTGDGYLPGKLPYPNL